MKIPWIVFVFLLALAGCESLQPGEQIPVPLNPQVSPTNPLAETTERANLQTPPGALTQQSETQIDPSLPIPAISGLPVAVEKAKADLAQRLSISTSQIEILETKEVFWGDSSLGCPQSGSTYAQVQTQGYLILLEAGGKEFEYHANLHNYVFYCENPTPPIIGTPVDIPS